MKQTSFFHCLFALALLLLPSSTIIAAERRTALVVGNAAYGDVGVLRNPVNDATDMDAALRRLGFAVTLLRDADLRTMQEAIETFLRQLRQGGVGLFYFAGHGMQVNGENYLIPLRARINREQDTPYEAVPVGRILGGMEDANNQINILILDACRENPYARQWRAGQRGLAVTQGARGSLIAFATAPGSVASDGSGRNGLYTSYLLQHMTTPGLSVEHMFKRARAGVIEATHGKQTPWETSSLIGDFAFAPQSPSSPSVTASPEATLALWDAVIARDVSKAMAAIRAGADANGLDSREKVAGPNGRRPLNYAALSNDTAMITALLEAGAEINLPNRSGFTPLHHAGEAGSKEAAALLIAKGADLTLRNARNQTPIETALAFRHPEVAKVIRQAMTTSK